MALAKQTGISQSKLSKIETGALIPSTEDLLRLFEVLSNVSSFPEAEAQRLIQLARELRTEYVSWRFGHRRGFGAKQIEIAELERQACLIRVFQVEAVPGLLQIHEYARRIITLANLTRQADLDWATSLRMQRQRILYEPDRRFEFLITEMATMSRFCEPAIAIRQIDRLKLLFDLPNVKIGFIPNQVPLPRAPQNSFVIYDSSTAVSETFTGEISTTDERDIQMYHSVFDEFAAVAEHGEAASVFLDECKRRLLEYRDALRHSTQSELELLER